MTEKIRTVTKEECPDYRFEVDENGNETGTFIDQYGNTIRPWQEIIRYAAGGFPPPGRWVAIDCGANIGVLTQAFMKEGGLVYAFEPNAAAYEYLHQRAVGVPQVRCYNKAVSDKNGTMKLYMHRKLEGEKYVHHNESEETFLKHVNYSQGCSLKGDKRNVNENHYQEVECIRLCDFIRTLQASDEVPPIFILKIDVEGAEVDLLRDLLDTGIAEEIPFILVEAHDEKVPSITEEMAVIRKRIDEGREYGKYHNIFLNWA
jgi:FkbM family methyltransferase